MSQVNRNQPRRGTASESRYTLFEFDKQFPDDAACLDYLMAERYPDGVFCEKCHKVTKHYREKARPSWSCEFCGHRVHPMVGTIFEDSATSLRLWFYGIYLMASTRCGISAKQLERELGVTYKTAWRMFHQIRSHICWRQFLIDILCARQKRLAAGCPPGPVRRLATLFSARRKLWRAREEARKSCSPGLKLPRKTCAA